MSYTKFGEFIHAAEHIVFNRYYRINRIAGIQMSKSTLSSALPDLFFLGSIISLLTEKQNKSTHLK